MPEYTIHNPDPTRPPDTIYLGAQPIAPNASFGDPDYQRFVDSTFIRWGTGWMDTAYGIRKGFLSDKGMSLTGASNYAIKKDARIDIQRLVDNPKVKPDVRELLQNHLFESQTTTVENYEL